jgi:DNA-directed RNA polymerase subunit M/transcription elongation factor TFIIS
MDIHRQAGNSALRTVLNKEQNIKIIEKNIYDMSVETCEEDEDIPDTYRRNLYQIITDIQYGIKLKDILISIKKKKIGWCHNFFYEMILKQEEQDEFILTPFEVEEGVLECKCGSKRVYSYNKQTRGSDEPCSTFAQCMSCKIRWVYSG